jgi:hypothetical protein
MGRQIDWRRCRFQGRARETVFRAVDRPPFSLELRALLAMQDWEQTLSPQEQQKLWEAR